MLVGSAGKGETFSTNFDYTALPPQGDVEVPAVHSSPRRSP
jgi:hypothetical protein